EAGLRRRAALLPEPPLGLGKRRLRRGHSRLAGADLVLARRHACDLELGVDLSQMILVAIALGAGVVELLLAGEAGGAQLGLPLEVGLRLAQRRLGLGALGSDGVDLGLAAAEAEVGELRLRLRQLGGGLVAGGALGSVIERKQRRAGRDLIATGDVDL